jgi:hypothetical protein
MFLELRVMQNASRMTWSAILHEEGRIATSMQKHYGLEHAFIKFFPYQQNSLSDLVRIATEWAETVLSAREGFYKISR